MRLYVIEKGTEPDFCVCQAFTSLEDAIKAFEELKKEIKFDFNNNYTIEEKKSNVNSVTIVVAYSDNPVVTDLATSHKWFDIDDYDDITFMDDYPDTDLYWDYGYEDWKMDFDGGDMPLERWNKEVIIDRLNGYRIDENVVKSMSEEYLMRHALDCQGTWRTRRYPTATIFYNISEDFVDELESI